MINSGSFEIYINYKANKSILVKKIYKGDMFGLEEFMGFSNKINY